MQIGDFHVQAAEESYEREAKRAIEAETERVFTYDAGSLYIQQTYRQRTETAVVPLNMALVACELLQTCKDLLAFIKTHDMGGDWCQDNYPAIQKARRVIRRAEDGPAKGEDA